MMKRITLVTSVLLITAVLGVFASQGRRNSMHSVDGSMKIHTYIGRTDSIGRFTIAHGLFQGCAGDRIYGATVAFQSSGNRQWYGAHALSENRFRYAWGDTHLSGIIERNPTFRNVPVRVVLFTTGVIC